MSANIEFNITAFDEASSVFDEVQTNATDCFDTVTTNANEAADAVETSSGQISSAVGSQNSTYQQAISQQNDINAAYGSGTPTVNAHTVSLQSNALAVSQVASAGAGLVMGVYSLESAEVSLDRAHVTVEKDTTAVAAAQLAYNNAVANYGSGSEQAQVASDKLTDAQNSLSVAQQRVGTAQNDVNSSMMQFGISIIPDVTSAFSGVSTIMMNFPNVSSAMSSGVEVLSGAFDGLDTSLIVVVAIVALGFALYEAYEHCAPFREAVNEIGTVLEEAFKTALTDIEKALSAVGAALDSLWHGVLLPVADFFKGVFAAALEFVMVPIDAFESAISKVAAAVKPLSDIIGGLSNALKGLCFAHAAPAAEEFNTQVSKSIELSNGLTQKLDPLKQGLLGVTGSASTTGAGSSQQQNQTQQQLISETKNLANVMSKLTATAKNSGTLNQGIAQSMARRF